jgi:hypothetical protein
MILTERERLADFDAVRGHMGEVPRWAICCRREVDLLIDNLIKTICPSREHEGDCNIPRSMVAVDGASWSEQGQAELREGTV